MERLKHKNKFNISFDNISHRIIDINVSDTGIISGTICILHTPKGEIVGSIIENKLPLYLSLRAITSILENGYKEIEQIITIDLVGKY